jgi:hypothetical protein
LLFLQIHNLYKGYVGASADAKQAFN